MKKKRREYRNVIFDRIHHFIDTQNLEGLKTIVYLSGGYVDESYDEIFSNIEDNSYEYQKFVGSNFYRLNFKKISNLVIVCNSTLRIIEEKFPEVFSRVYFNWILSKIKYNWGFTIALHLSKKSNKFNRLLNHRIEEGELNDALIKIYKKVTLSFSASELFNILKYHEKNCSNY